MASVSLVTLRGLVRLRLASVSTDSKLTDTVVTGLVNEGLRQLALEHDWYWLLSTRTYTTVVDCGGYTLPDDFLRAFSVYDSTTGLAIPVSPIADIDAVTYSGVPQGFNIFGSAMLLRPIPADARDIILRYVRTETTLASDSDTPLVPLAFANGAVQWAAKLGFDYVRDTVGSLAAAKDYHDWVERARDNLIRTRAPLRVRVRPGSAF